MGAVRNSFHRGAQFRLELLVAARIGDEPSILAVRLAFNPPVDGELSLCRSSLLGMTYLHYNIT